MKKVICTMLACLLLINTVNAGALAISTEESGRTKFSISLPSVRAAGSFKTNIPAETLFLADKELPLAKGDIVEIEAKYSPSGSVDVGLIDSDGIFHYLTVTDGVIDERILIEENGNYLFGIRNNSTDEILITGFISY